MTNYLGKYPPDERDSIVTIADINEYDYAVKITERFTRSTIVGCMTMSYTVRY